MDQEFTFETTVDPSGLAAIRTFIEETLESLEVKPEAALGVLVAVNELTTNIFEHGYQTRPGRLELWVALVNDDLQIRLQDEAPPFDPSSSPAFDADKPLHERRRGGMGIQLARSYADDITYRLRPEGGNEVTLVISKLRLS